MFELTNSPFVDRHYEEFYKANGYIPKMFNAYNCQEVIDVAPTQTCTCGSSTSSSAVLIMVCEDEE